ncbi:hypothetical protein HOI83_03675 [Candidatus Uhrbacteria bacterium]|jgi:hypothetical protein|nr:hypothetical protein [Candidatus Uhrbacteria bacterium]
MIENYGLTIQVIGEVLIAFTLLRVHHRVLSDRKIDKKVFSEMKLEQKFGYIGVACIVAGYLIQVI